MAFFLLVYAPPEGKICSLGVYLDKKAGQKELAEILNKIKDRDDREVAKVCHYALCELETLTSRKPKLFIVLDDDAEEGITAHGPWICRKEAQKCYVELLEEYDEDDQALTADECLRVIEIDNPYQIAEIPA